MRVSRRALFKLSLAIGFVLLLQVSDDALASSLTYITYTYAGQFDGSLPSSDGTFKNPIGLAFDPNNDLFVVDSGNNRVEELDTSGNVLLSFGESGSGDGKFSDPYGIAVDANNNVFVSDSGNFRVQKFAPEYAPDLVTITGYQYERQWGGEGSGSGQFNQPYGIAVDSKNNVYVVDGVNHNIQIFNNVGGLVGSCDTGTFGVQTTPQGIALDTSGNIYVSDPNNNIVEKFSPTTDNLGNVNGCSYVNQFGTNGEGVAQFQGPTGVAVDAEGNIFVSDTGNNRAQVFDQLYNYLSQFGSAGIDPGQFSSQTDLSLAFNRDNGYIYVADSGNNRVQIFCANSGTYTDCTVDEPSSIVLFGTGLLLTLFAGGSRKISYKVLGQCSGKAEESIT